MSTLGLKLIHVSERGTDCKPMVTRFTAACRHGQNGWYLAVDIYDCVLIQFSMRSNWQEVSIGSGYASPPNRRQTRTNVDPVFTQTYTRHRFSMARQCDVPRRRPVSHNECALIGWNRHETFQTALIFVRLTGTPVAETINFPTFPHFEFNFAMEIFCCT